MKYLEVTGLVVIILLMSATVPMIIYLLDRGMIQFRHDAVEQKYLIERKGYDNYIDIDTYSIKNGCITFMDGLSVKTTLCSDWSVHPMKPL